MAGGGLFRTQMPLMQNSGISLIKKPDLGVKILMRISELLVNRLKQSSQDVISLTTALSIALSK